MRDRLCSIILALMLVMGAMVLAKAQVEKPLPPVLEDRARSLFLELRCVVCQNQSIGDSDADVAKDLRIIVREQIAAGQSDKQIKQFLVVRYGEFILLRPVFAWHTALLWGGPLVLLVIGGFMAARSGRGGKKPILHGALSPEEENELAEILKQRENQGL